MVYAIGQRDYNFDIVFCKFCGMQACAMIVAVGAALSKTKITIDLGLICFKRELQE